MRSILILLCFVLCLDSYAQKNCGTTPYWQEELKRDPAILSRQQAIEEFTRNRTHLRELHPREQGLDPIESLVINIPVVVHVLYKEESQNISKSQIQAQLDILNADFRMMNSDLERIPNAFAPFAADCQFHFELAKVDPQGRATDGIVRKQTSRMFWLQDDLMKSNSFGGDNGWDPRSYLNIWVCNLVSNLLGYSTFPGAAQNKDGVVIRTDVFGPNNYSAYNLGRTTTHEIGHWLNLKHLWGDADCGDDGVDDTPKQKTYNNGCPSFPETKNACGSNTTGDMFMDFMDFSDDACMQMFTKGQRQRMRDLFAEGGPRSSILNSRALSDPWNTEPNPSPATIASLNLQVYPNPASDLLYLRFDDGTIVIGKSYKIFTTDGKLVLSGSYNLHGAGIDISKLNSGIYLFKLEGTSSYHPAKFIKQ